MFVRGMGRLIYFNKGGVKNCSHIVSIRNCEKMHFCINVLMFLLFSSFFEIVYEFGFEILPTNMKIMLSV